MNKLYLWCVTKLASAMSLLSLLWLVIALFQKHFIIAIFLYWILVLCEKLYLIIYLINSLNYHNTFPLSIYCLNFIVKWIKAKKVKITQRSPVTSGKSGIHSQIGFKSSYSQLLCLKIYTKFISLWYSSCVDTSITK